MSKFVKIANDKYVNIDNISEFQPYENTIKVLYKKGGGNIICFSNENELQEFIDNLINK